MVVVAERLPEAGLDRGDEAEAANPFRALPEVQVRHDQASRPAVCRLAAAARRISRPRRPGR